jgi:ferredoxin
MTLACKIMYGSIPGITKTKYHAQFLRRVAFADMLLDVAMFVHAKLYIMDGILGMQGQGPGSGDPINLGWLLAATDPVAMDIAVCRLVGIEPIAIPVLKRAKVRKLWPQEIAYPILAPEDIAYQGFKLPNTADYLLTGKKAPSKRPMVTEKCVACGDCVEICPKHAIRIKDQRAFVDDSKCIRCFCCHEVCPEKAIDLVAARRR